MRIFIKTILNRICQLIIMPFATMCLIENIFFLQSEIVFAFFAQMFSLVPGLPGEFFRRAFYSLVLEKFSLGAQIGFGSIFTHRKAIVEEQVSIGHFSVIGSVSIGKRCQIASRVSITSGKKQHVKNTEGHWTAFDLGRLHRVNIGDDVWIGESAIVMEDIGNGSMVAAGSVVASPVGIDVIVGGNPAKVIESINREKT